MQALIAERSQPLPPALASWLQDKNSLTLRLKTQCRQFDVRRLGEWRAPAAQEGPGWQAGDPLWHREVLLLLDGVPWVYALTEVPLATFAAGDIDFQTLGERPLGELLFATDSLSRGSLTFTRHDVDSRAGQVALELGQPLSHPLWGRSRQFTLSDRPLRVNEIFLPAAERALGA
ncbi:chorismate--pyruvate lyase family protein [Ferrimonas balearica]|uniref:chorismate--pyruvate lyase family protein n=1 Tax=Ferrimonas balearica TaxID=44012 RepID=UPI001C99E5FF|nr:chorismate lyase [Ferrimonas balearica]MBY5994066.1 chorismate lyase [Ferrimonas balearica]